MSAANPSRSKTVSGTTLSSSAKATTDKWAAKDVAALIAALQRYIPTRDSFKYVTTQKKIHWVDVGTALNRSGEECKAVYMNVLKSVRTQRTFSEILEDAQKMCGGTTSGIQKVLSSVNHYTDIPQKPKVAFLRYHAYVLPKLKRKHPDETFSQIAKRIGKGFKKLSAEKREKYDASYRKDITEYHKAMQEFSKQHPEFCKKKWLDSKTEDFGFSASLRTFAGYKYKIDGKVDMQKAKIKWGKMSDRKKVKWIRATEERFAMEQVQNPDATLKSLLTAKERSLLDEAEGKPKKPPLNGYTLFCNLRREMAKGDEADDAHISQAPSYMWKNYPASEKDVLNKRAFEEQRVYRSEVETYLAGLSDNRKTVFTMSQPKRGGKKKAESLTRNGAVNPLLNGEQELSTSSLPMPPAKKRQKIVKEETTLQVAPTTFNTQEKKKVEKKKKKKEKTNLPQNMEAESSTTSENIKKSSGKDKKKKHKRKDVTPERKRSKKVSAVNGAASSAIARVSPDLSFLKPYQEAPQLKKHSASSSSEESSSSSSGSSSDDVRKPNPQLAKKTTRKKMKNREKVISKSIPKLAKNTTTTPMKYKKEVSSSSSGEDSDDESSDGNDVQKSMQNLTRNATTNKTSKNREKVISKSIPKLAKNTTTTTMKYKKEVSSSSSGEDSDDESSDSD